VGCSLFGFVVIDNDACDVFESLDLVIVEVVVVDEVVNVVEETDVGVVGLLVVVKGVVVLKGLLILFVVVDVT